MASSVTTAAPKTSGFTVPGLRWWIAGLLMGVTIVNYLDRTCLGVAGPVLKKELSINEVDFANIVVAFQFTYLLMQPISGRIVDWLNLRIGLAVSLGWWSGAQMLTGFATGWPGFAAFRALLGIGEAANFPAGAKTVSQWFHPRERTVATGVFNVGAGLGQAIATPFVVFLLLRFNWQTAFVVTGAIGMVWVVVWLLFYRSPEKHPWMSSKELAYIREGQNEIAIEGEEPAATGVWRVVLRQRNFWALAFARFLSEPAWQFFTYWIPLYLVTERHLKLKEVAYFAWVPFIAGDLGCIFGGFLSPFFIRMGKSVLTARKLSATVCGVIMMGAIFIGSAPTAGWAVVFFCVGAFAHQAMSSTLLTLPADLFPKRSVATANGLSGMIGGLGGLLFTKVVGQVAMTIGYAPLFIAIAFFDLIGALLLWSFMHEYKGRRAVAS